MELLIGGNWGFLKDAPCRGDPNLICHQRRKLPCCCSTNRYQSSAAFYCGRLEVQWQKYDKSQYYSVKLIKIQICWLIHE